MFSFPAVLFFVMVASTALDACLLGTANRENNNEDNIAVLEAEYDETYV